MPNEQPQALPDFSDYLRGARLSSGPFVRSYRITTLTGDAQSACSLLSSDAAPTTDTVVVKACKRCRRNFQLAQINSCCGYCTEYCGCVCKKCGTCTPKKNKRFPPTHFCAYCGQCRTICKCRKRKGYLNVDKLSRPRTHINKLNRMMGLELEIADWGSLSTEFHAKNFTYNITRDGSVKPSGLELVVHPLAGDALLRGVFELGELFAKNNCLVNNTCGFHVHVNAQDMNWWSLRRMIYLYMAVEHDIYYHMITPERARNCHYYKPARETWEKVVADVQGAVDTDVIKHRILKHLYPDHVNAMDGTPSGVEKGRLWGSVKNSKYGVTSRYYGLNLHSYFYRGTVEFRMYQGTTALEDLVNWPLLCGWMVEKANNLTDNEVLKLGGLRDFADQHLPVALRDWVFAKLSGPPNPEVNDEAPPQPPREEELPVMYEERERDLFEEDDIFEDEEEDDEDEE